MATRKKTNRGYNKQTNAKAIAYKGKHLRSGLEKTMYKLLEENKIPFSYEKRKFTIIEGLFFDNESYEKFLNGRGDFINRGNKKVVDSKYTPDFTNPDKESLEWVIETKGRAMPDFSRTWKLFKNKLVRDKIKVILFVPRTKKDCEKVIKKLIQKGYGTK